MNAEGISRFVAATVLFIGCAARTTAAPPAPTSGPANLQTAGEGTSSGVASQGVGGGGGVPNDDTTAARGGDGGASAAGGTRTGSSSRGGSNLPAPRPTTIRLATPGSHENVDVELGRGDDAFETNDLAQASKHYEAARGLAPDRPGPLVGIARVRIARTDLPLDFAAAKGNAEVVAAAKDLRRAAQLGSAFGPAQVELGRALLLLGDASGALDALKRGAQLLPTEPEAQSALGVAELATGHGDEAVAALAQASQLDPGSAARHGNLGTALFMKGRVKEAIKEYELQAEVADGEARAHSDLGTALLADSQTTRATRELERAIALDPKRATFHNNFGYALALEGKRNEALGEYRLALKLDERLASAWINLATVLAHDVKTRAEARAALEKARAIDPTDPRVKANLQELDALEHGGTAP